MNKVTADLLAACETVIAFLDRLEDPEIDPATSQLGKLRRQIHAPLRAALEPAIANAKRADYLPTRRLAKLAMSEEMFLTLLRCDFPLTQNTVLDSTIPADVQILGAEFQWDRLILTLLCSSAEFADVPTSAEIPFLDIRYSTSQRSAFDLTPEEIETIESWYMASAGESAHNRTVDIFALLDKLGIHAVASDLYKPDPMDTIAESRHNRYAEVDAITAYRKRHPDYEEVIEAEEDQP